MAAKKDKMIPSEKERKRALKYATPAGTGQMWVTMGIAFIIFGIILLLIPIGLAISEASAQRYDPESIHTATLVYLENSNYGVDEIGCFDVKGVRLFLDDDTILVVRYTNGIWRIEIERKGTAPYQHEVCAGNDEADYSDIFCTESDVIAHEIIR